MTKETGSLQELWWKLPSQGPTCDELIASGKPGYALADFEAAMNPRAAMDSARVIEIAQMEGHEVLTAGSKGARSVKQLDETGIPFSLGYANPCIAVGIFHEDIGIAGAHKQSVTVSSSFESYKRALNDPSFLLEFNLANIYEKHLLMSTPQSRRSVVQATTQEALSEFINLAGGNIPSKWITVTPYGVSYIPLDEQIALDRRVLAIVTKHPQIPAGAIEFSSKIGSGGELIYGGKNHPKYPIPTFQT